MPVFWAAGSWASCGGSPVRVAAPQARAAARRPVLAVPRVPASVVPGAAAPTRRATMIHVALAMARVVITFLLAVKCWTHDWVGFGHWHGERSWNGLMGHLAQRNEP